MSYINNLFSLNRNLSKKYRLATPTLNLFNISDADNNVNRNVKSNTDPDPNPNPGSNPGTTSSQPPASRPPTPEQKQESINRATEEAKNRTNSNPISPVVATATESSNKVSKPKATSKDNFIKNAANRAAGVVLGTKNALGDIANAYAKKRMETFLYFGGGFSPATRERVMKDSDRDFQKFIADSHLKGKGFSMFGGDYAKLHTLFDQLHATKMSDSTRESVIQSLFNAHTKKDGHFSHFGLDEIIKNIKEQEKAQLGVKPDPLQDSATPGNINPPGPPPLTTKKT